MIGRLRAGCRGLFGSGIGVFGLGVLCSATLNLAVGLYTHNWLNLLAAPLVIALIAVALLIYSRIGTPLDRDTKAILREVADDADLVDPQSGQVLLVSRRHPLPCLNVWTICRFEADSVNEAMTDFNLGEAISTVPYTRYAYHDGYLAATERALPVKPSEAAGPEPVEEPSMNRRQLLREALFHARHRLLATTEGEAERLALQLARATPLDLDGGDDRAS